MRTTPRVVAAVALVVGAVACDDGSGPPATESLCATVQAWSDTTADAVNAFRVASRELDPGGRRARYDEAFGELRSLHDRLVEGVDRLDLAEAVTDRLDVAFTTVGAIVETGATQAVALPDTAFRFVAVREGKLVTSFEKARVTVYHALAELADDDSTGVPPGCGRRDPRDFTPSVTFPA